MSESLHCNSEANFSISSNEKKKNEINNVTKEETKHDHSSLLRMFESKSTVGIFEQCFLSSFTLGVHDHTEKSQKNNDEFLRKSRNDQEESNFYSSNETINSKQSSKKHETEERNFINIGCLGQNVVLVGEICADETSSERDEASIYGYNEWTVSTFGIPNNEYDRKIYFFLLFLKFSIFISIIIICIFTFTHFNFVMDLLQTTTNWLKSKGYLSPIVFTLIYTVLTVAFVPAELLTIWSGFVFTSIYGKLTGFIVAYVISITGMFIGAIICFTVSRHLLFTHINYYFRSSLMYNAFESAVEDAGSLFVALLRLSPIIPFTLSNYILGITPLKFYQFMLGTLGSLPLTLIFISIGSAINSLSDISFDLVHFGLKNVLLFIFGLTMALMALIYIFLLTRRKLRLYTNNLISVSPSSLLVNYRNDSNCVKSQNTSKNENLLLQKHVLMSDNEVVHS